MAAWFNDITSKAESFITNLDSSAAEVLKKSTSEQKLAPAYVTHDQIYNEDILESPVESVINSRQPLNYSNTVSVINENEGANRPKSTQKRNKPQKITKVTVKNTEATQDDWESEIRALQEEVYQLRENSSTLETELTEAQTKIKDLQSLLSAKDNQLHNVNIEAGKSSELIREKEILDHMVVDLKQKLETCEYENKNIKASLSQLEVNHKKIQRELQNKLSHTQDLLSLSNEKSIQLTKEISENRAKYLSIIKSKDDQIGQSDIKESSNILLSSNSEEDATIASLREQVSSLTLETQRSRDLCDQMQLQLNQSQSKIFQLQNNHDQLVKKEEFNLNEIEHLQEELTRIQDRVSQEKQSLHEEYSKLVEENASLKMALEETQVRKNELTRYDTNQDSQQVKYFQEKIKLEAKVKELNSRIMQTLNSESALLTENQALRIQLQNMKEKNIEVSERNINSFQADRITNQYQQMKISTGMTCVRLDVEMENESSDSAIPKTCYPILEKADSYIIYLGNILRRRPGIRLLFFGYIILLNFWFCFSSMLFTPHDVNPELSTNTQN